MDQASLMNFFDRQLKEDFPIAKLLTRFLWRSPFFQKNFYWQFFVKNNLQKIDFFSFYATGKKKKISRNQERQGRVNAITKLICYSFFVVGSLPEFVSGTPFTFAPRADSNSRTYIFQLVQNFTLEIFLFQCSNKILKKSKIWYLCQL